MSIDDKQEKLYRESRMSERIADASPEKKILKRESFAMLNRDVIEEVIKDLESCEDKLFDYIYSKYTPCDECVTKDEKIRYLAESYPNRIKHNLEYFKNEFYSGNTKRKSKYPSNGVIGWGVTGFSNSFHEDVFSSRNLEVNKTPVINRESKFKPKESPKKSFTRKIEKRPEKSSSSNLKSQTVSPTVNPVEVSNKVNALDEETFNIMLLLLGVPKSLERQEKIDFIINNYREVRIDAAINHAKKIKP